MEDWEWDEAKLYFPIQSENLKSLGVTSLIKLGLELTMKGEGHVTLMGTKKIILTQLYCLFGLGCGYLNKQ